MVMMTPSLWAIRDKLRFYVAHAQPRGAPYQNMDNAFDEWAESAVLDPRWTGPAEVYCQGYADGWMDFGKHWAKGSFPSPVPPMEHQRPL